MARAALKSVPWSPKSFFEPKGSGIADVDFHPESVKYVQNNKERHQMIINTGDEPALRHVRWARKRVGRAVVTRPL